ncbi:MAG: 3-phosphoshikimate 1-carboxyvinyltransferase [Candidatus Obscuribacter sp.]|jgi:3-phosphoshikimate 1-carboxyvinyltransferase|nr:3-phosphoshikimate 1-carboxyvinyltransferase [Candidatus Obscuribacter sp.]
MSDMAANKLSSLKKPRLSGSLRPPGDKSITHRALIFAALVKGYVQIKGALQSFDTVTTVNAMRKLGLDISPLESDPTVLRVASPGLTRMARTHITEEIDCGNSGTTMRLLSGLVCSLNGSQFAFDGDESLQKRDMSRVLTLVGSMGAKVDYLAELGYAPFVVRGGSLRGGEFVLPVSSAQVCTSLILAGLKAAGVTTVSTPYQVRDHSVRLLKFMGVDITADELKCSVKPLAKDLPGTTITVPGDLSSAAFFMVAAAILPGSKITMQGVGLNPGRTLVIDVLREMGVPIVIANESEICGEPVGDVTVVGPDSLAAVTIPAASVARGIDELPLLTLAFVFAQGRSAILGAQELKTKESNRLASIFNNLSEAGAKVESFADSIFVEGEGVLPGGSHWTTLNDHRLAMTGLIANLASEQPILPDSLSSIGVSYPHFEKDLASLVVSN